MSTVRLWLSQQRQHTVHEVADCLGLFHQLIGHIHPELLLDLHRTFDNIEAIPRQITQQCVTFVDFFGGISDDSATIRLTSSNTWVREEKILLSWTTFH